MSAKPLTVAVPETLLKRIRGRARRAKRTVEAEVIQLLTVAVSAENAEADRISEHLNGAGGLPKKAKARKDNMRNGKHSSTTPSAEEELAPDIVEAMAKIEQLDIAALHEAAKPLMTAKQAKRAAALNRKAQDEGLTDAEEKERDELLHIYGKSMVVRSAALAELHKRGVDVSNQVAP